MKSILLTSTALVAFAGYASAEAHETAVGTTWAADGEFGYNEEVEGGFYFDGGLAVSAAAALNSDITAGISADIDLGFTPNSFGDTGGSAFGGISVNASDFVIFVESDTASLYIGDTETASQQIWSGVTNMETDGFLEVGDVDDGPAEGDFVDGVMRGDLTFGAVEASVSYFFADQDLLDTDNDTQGLTGLQAGASTTFGNFEIGAVYQEGVSDGIVNAVDSADSGDGIIGVDDLASDGNGTIDEIFGIYAGTSFAGADVKVAYSMNQDTDASSTAIGVSYPFGPVTLGAFYSIEEDGNDDTDEDDNYGVSAGYSANGLSVNAYFHDGQDEEIGVEGSYDVGNGLTVYAGYVDSADDDQENREEYYIAAEYDLGSGASLIGAYGETGDDYDGSNDEIGNAFEVNEGVTVAVSFSF